MRIRLGTNLDRPRLRRLDNLSAVADEHEGIQTYVLRRKGILDYFLQCQGLIVAEDDDKIVGYMLTHTVDWMHGVSKMIWIEHTGVHPQHRHRGVGYALLKFTRRYYKGKAVYLYAEIHPNNRNLLALFRKAGAEMWDRVLAFRKI